ncbi:hypothetical protein [Candidatus Poriferisodalis sp.]|uniref:hypothetical protein n=1 Tax=Candidatus Poriferisodalis sp. TaxID=3101277 RepID=UPI003D1329BD
MKVITLPQPHVFLIAGGHKTREACSVPAPQEMRGARFGIHAGVRKPTIAELCRIMGHAPGICCSLSDLEALRREMAYGAVVATARLRGCVQVLERQDEAHAREPHFYNEVICGSITGQPTDALVQFNTDGLGDYSVGRWVWLLEDIEPLDEPVPARGKPRIWDWEPPHIDADARSRQGEGE